MSIPICRKYLFHIDYSKITVIIINRKELILQEFFVNNHLTNESLTKNERDYLLKVVRETIKNRLFNKKTDLPSPPTERLNEDGAVFVTLTINGNLRGCIGSIIPYESLIENIKKMSVEAAFSDPRFPPLTKEEFNKIKIEISRLTPIEPVKDISEIIVGKHGLIMTKGFNRGLLLPQVPLEYNWDLKTFLSQTCIKSGLPKDCWQDNNIKIEKFSAEVWSEKD